MSNIHKTASRPAACFSVALSWLQACGCWIILARNTLTPNYPIITASVNLIVKMVSIIWLFLLILFLVLMGSGPWFNFSFPQTLKTKIYITPNKDDMIITPKNQTLYFFVVFENKNKTLDTSALWLSEGIILSALPETISRLGEKPSLKCSTDACCFILLLLTSKFCIYVSVSRSVIFKLFLFNLLFSLNRRCKEGENTFCAFKNKSCNVRLVCAAAVNLMLLGNNHKPYSE